MENDDSNNQCQARWTRVPKPGEPLKDYHYTWRQCVLDRDHRDRQEPHDWGLEA